MAQPGPLKSTQLPLDPDGGDAGPLETEVMGGKAAYPQGMCRNQHQRLARPSGVELDALR